MRRVLLSLALASGCFGAGCATGKGNGPTTAQPQAALAYFPLKVGNAWSYMVKKPDENDAVLVTSVVKAVTDQTALLESGGKIVRYEIKPDGLLKPAAGYYMLHDPIQPGAHWTMPGSGKVEVASTGTTETVDAGTFTNCIVVVEELTGDQRAEWTYAAGVGPIRMRIFDLRAAEPELILVGELKSYDLKGTPPAPGT